MYQLTSLIKRNIKVFLRDKAAVFFSFLSVLILVLLYFLFLNNTYKSGLPDILTEKDKTLLTTSQMMGGVLVINTLTLALGMMGNMVNDIYFKKIESFLVTPAKRSTITLSYYISSNIVTYVLSLFMWLLTILYVFVSTGFMYSLSVIINVSLLLALYTFISSSIMIFIISFIKSVNAFGTISGVLGTFIGFVSGIYMPLTILPSAIRYIASINPFTHMTILLKQQLLNKPISLLADKLGTEGLKAIKESYGVNEIGIFGQNVNMFFIMIGITLIAIIIFFVTMKRLTRKSR